MHPLGKKGNAHTSGLRVRRASAAKKFEVRFAGGKEGRRIISYANVQVLLRRKLHLYFARGKRKGSYQEEITSASCKCICMAERRPVKAWFRVGTQALRRNL